MDPLAAHLSPHTHVIKQCGNCRHWQTPSADVSCNPRSDTGMAALGLRPCAVSDQTWRYLPGHHRCHHPQELAR